MKERIISHVCPFLFLFTCTKQASCLHLLVYSAMFIAAILLINCQQAYYKDVRAQKFPRTGFFTTLTVGRK